MSLRESSSSVLYKNWVFIHSILNILGVGFTAWQEDILLWLILNLLSFGFLISRIRTYLIDFPSIIGYANWATVFRLILLFSLGLLLDTLSEYVLFSLFTLAIIMDGIDGYLARRFQHHSEFGARMDMETDAFLVMLLTLHHALAHRIPEWILIPALMRYLLGFFTYFVKTREVRTRSKLLRSTIAVIFFLSLLLAFVLPANWTYHLTSVAGGLILLSFGLEIIEKLSGGKI